MAAKRKSIVLTLVKCGQTAWHAASRVHGASDLPLSAEGRDAVTSEAQSLAGRHMGTIYHGPDEAASETAAILAAVVRAKTRAVEGLAEADLGVLEGLSEQAFGERFPRRHKQWVEDPLSLSPPEGEEILEARARVFTTVARLLRRARAEEVGVVLHPLSLGLLRCWLGDCPPTEAWAQASDRPSIERYLLATEQVARLEEAARVQFSQA